MGNAKNRVRATIGIIGGIVGLVSLALPWVRFHAPIVRSLGKDFTLLKLTGISEIGGSSILGHENVRLFFLVVLGVLIIGSLIAFFKSWGGVIQLIGVVIFAIGVNSDILSVSVSPVFDPLRKDTASVATLDYAFQPGFYIALLASVITMIGFAFKAARKNSSKYL